MNAAGKSEDIRADGSTASMTIDGCDLWRSVSRLCRKGPYPNAPSRRHRDPRQSCRAQRRPSPPTYQDRRRDRPAPASLFNPIEQMWRKVKEHLRNAKARTKQALDEAIVEALACVTPQSAQHWFEYCGYETCQDQNALIRRGFTTSLLPHEVVRLVTLCVSMLIRVIGDRRFHTSILQPKGPK